MQDEYFKLLPIGAKNLIKEGNLNRDAILPPRFNGSKRLVAIPVDKIYIKDMNPVTEEDLEACGCDINMETSFDNHGKTK